MPMANRSVRFCRRWLKRYFCPIDHNPRLASPPSFLTVRKPLISQSHNVKPCPSYRSIFPASLTKISLKYGALSLFMRFSFAQVSALAPKTPFVILLYFRRWTCVPVCLMSLLPRTTDFHSAFHASFRSIISPTSRIRQCYFCF